MKWNPRLTAFIVALAMPFTLASGPSPDVNPANFVSQVTNPYFPLQPGTTFFYKGVKDGTPTIDKMLVTHETKEILGVTCTVVRDLAFEDGELAEDTADWYAQDVQGNVWYFGEGTRELDENGNVVSTEGSWEAGVNGAVPGIVMEAAPQPRDHYYQEFAQRVAEDQATVLRLGLSRCVAYGCLHDVLQTREWTRLSPDEIEIKEYAKGVGFIRGVIVKGGNERSELVRVTTGNP